MATNIGLTSVLGAALLAVFGLTGPVLAAQSGAPADEPQFERVAGQTSIPIGHVEFCKTHRGACGPNADVVDKVTLTKALWQQLLDVNNKVNTTVTPVTDMALYHVAEYWTYPHGYGDCEDYALEKRRELIAMGWPASTLLMTVARQTNGEGHAVLTVRTDRGDLILDNQNGLIRLWENTPYHYLKRQSQVNSAEWVAIVDNRPLTVLASAH